MWTGAGQYQGKADSTIYIQLIHYLHGNASNNVLGFVITLFLRKLKPVLQKIKNVLEC